VEAVITNRKKRRNKIIISLPAIPKNKKTINNMKRNTMRIVAVATFVATAFSVNAQTALKLGHINSAEILALMPESKVADGELQKYGQSLEAQLKTMGAEYQGKVEVYQNKKELMADAIKQTNEKEIVDLQNRIQEFQQTAQESIQKKKEELYSPILKKAEETIKEVAKENAYTYILDSSQGVVLYSQEGSDIGPLVKKKLNLPLTAPAATTTPGGTPAARPVNRRK
jgi:outer membrane protein